MSERIKAIIWLVILIAILVIAGLFLNSRKNNEDIKNTNELGKNKIIEVNDKNFEDEVINSSKKVLIDFYATWCGPCKKLKPVLEQIASENDNIKIVEIDVDKCQNLAAEYGIQAMPTLVVISNGKEVKRSIGVIPKDKILKLLEQ